LRNAIIGHHEDCFCLGFGAFLSGNLVTPHVPSGALEAVAEIAGEFPLVRRAWFFGSRLTGVSHRGGPVRPDSDLDIAFEIESDSTMPKVNSQLTLFLEIRGLEIWTELERRFGCRFGLTLLDDVRTHIIEGNEPKELIFDRESGK
jgi:predicted nucleotidyltransferase